MQQTPEAIAALKANWLSDPGCYDIEETEGFEEQRLDRIAEDFEERLERSADKSTRSSSRSTSSSATSRRFTGTP